MIYTPGFSTKLREDDGRKVLMYNQFSYTSVPEKILEQALGTPLPFPDTPCEMKPYHWPFRWQTMDFCHEGTEHIVSIVRDKRNRVWNIFAQSEKVAKALSAHLELWADNLTPLTDSPFEGFWTTDYNPKEISDWSGED